MIQTQTGLRMCLQCGCLLFGRKQLYCSDAHWKAYKRRESKKIGERLKTCADGNLSAFNDEEREELKENLASLIKWQRINEHNPHRDAQKASYEFVADLLQIVLDGVRNDV